mmetsp:Transcript_12462/g.52227  ORF Transcript_12462/g.52227 Transcript_12462/m.52227 type:complete len:365 (+) Transcript_12462:950-2044(+)
MPISARRRALPKMTCSRPDMGASASPKTGNRQVSEGVLPRALLVTTSVALERRIELGLNRNGNKWLPRAATTTPRDADFVCRSSNLLTGFSPVSPSELTSPFATPAERPTETPSSSNDAVIDTACSCGFVNVTACEPLCPSVTNKSVGGFKSAGATPTPETRHRHVPAAALVAITVAWRVKSSVDGLKATVIFPFSNGASVKVFVLGETIEKTFCDVALWDPRPTGNAALASGPVSSHSRNTSTVSSVGFWSRSLTSAGAPPNAAVAGVTCVISASSATSVAGYQNSPKTSCVNDTEPRDAPATSGEYVTSYEPLPFAGSVSVGAPSRPCPSQRARNTAGAFSGLVSVNRAVVATRTGARSESV